MLCDVWAIPTYRVYRPSDKCSNLDPDEERPLCILKFRKIYLYTIPSFTVITVQLVVQGEGDDGRLKIVDVFLRRFSTIDTNTKAGCLVELGYNNYEVK